MTLQARRLMALNSVPHPFPFTTVSPLHSSDSAFLRLRMVENNLRWDRNTVRNVLCVTVDYFETSYTWGTWGRLVRFLYSTEYTHFLVNTSISIT